MFAAHGVQKYFLCISQVWVISEGREADRTFKVGWGCSWVEGWQVMRVRVHLASAWIGMEHPMTPECVSSPFVVGWGHAAYRNGLCHCEICLVPSAHSSTSTEDDYHCSVSRKVSLVWPTGAGKPSVWIDAISPCVLYGGIRQRW